MHLSCPHCGEEQSFATGVSMQCCRRCEREFSPDPLTENSNRASWRACEQLLDRFDAAWNAGDRPDLDTIYADQSANGSSLLFELAVIDLEYRIKQGESAGAADYFEKYPNLEANRSRAVELIETEYRFRNRLNDELTIAECLDRYPQFRSELTLRLDNGDSGPRKIAVEPTLERGRRIGRFELIECVGHGAFGAVYRARDDDLDRDVAIKIPRSWSFATQEDEERFVREAKNVGRLKHPGIVGVHEVGRDNGMPFIVTEFVEGQTLADAHAAERVVLDDVPELLAAIADALAYAHQAGVVHRDLKPANIMLEVGDTARRIRILDFGLARDSILDATMTQEGQILGTPAYMSPEQARGESHIVDGRADVYSLGAMMYLLLTGVPPFQGNARMVVRQAMHDMPVNPRQLNPEVPRDLETICLKCLEKEPGRRFATADEFAEEIRRHQRGEPIRSRPITQFGRLRRWCGRNRLVASLAFGMVFAMVGGLIAVGWQWLRAESLADDERRQRLAADASAAEAKSARELSDELRQQAQASAIAAQNEQRRTRYYLYVAHMNLVKQAWESANTDRMRELLRKYVPKPGEEDLRTFAWYHWWWRCHREQRTVDLGVTNTRNMAVCPGKNFAVVISNGKTATVVDLKTGQIRHRLKHDARPNTVSISPDRRRIVTTTTEGLFASISVWSTETGLRKHRFRAHRGVINCAVFSHGGGRLATVGNDRVVRLWNTETWQTDEMLRRKRKFAPACLAFSPDDDHLVVGGGDLELWSLNQPPKLRVVKHVHSGYTRSIAVSPDGNRIATTGGDFRIVIRDGKLLNRQATTPALSTPTLSLQFSPDSRKLISTGLDQRVRIWNGITAKLLADVRGHSAPVFAGGFLGDGRGFVSLDNVGRLKFWDVDVEPGLWRWRLAPSFDAALSPDGRSIASSDSFGGVHVCETGGGRVLKRLSTGKRSISRVDWSPDGRALVACNANGTTIRWSTDGWKKLQFERPPIEWSMSNIAWIADIVVSVDMVGRLFVYDAATGRIVKTMRGAGRRLAYSRDKATIINSGTRGIARFDIQAKQLHWIARKMPGAVGALAVSPDGRQAAVVDNRVIEIWNLEDRRLERTLRGHSKAVMAIEFSPDGKTLATSGHDRRVKLWDLRTGESTSTLSGHTNAVYSLRFSPDGRTLYTGGVDASIRNWRTAGYDVKPR